MPNAIQIELLRAGIEYNGAALASGKVYTYQPGTTTEKATYTDAEATTSAANPIILDSNGRAVVFGDGVYKFVIKTSADVTVYTWDNLTYLPQGEAIVKSNYTAAGTDTYTVSITGVTAYNTGDTYFMKVTNANTATAPTLNISALGAKTIKKEGSAALLVGDIPAGHEAIFRYNGTNMILLNPIKPTSATAFELEHNAGGTHKVITVDSANNRIGINYATPLSELDVYRNVAGGYARIRLINGDTTAASAGAFAMMDFWMGATPTFIGQIGGYGSNYNSATYANFLKVAGDVAGVIIRAIGPAGIIKFMTGPAPTEWMRITTAGNIGIGTTIPTQKLQIENPGASNSLIAFSHDDSVKGVIGSDTANNIVIQGNTQPIVMSADGMTNVHLHITTTGNVGLAGTGGSDASPPVISDGPGVHIAGKILRLDSSKTPATAAAAGNTGEMCWDSSYFYICTAANTWRRIAHNTW